MFRAISLTNLEAQYEEVIRNLQKLIPFFKSPLTERRKPGHVQATRSKSEKSSSSFTSVFPSLLASEACTRDLRIRLMPKIDFFALVIHHFSPGQSFKDWDEISSHSLRHLPWLAQLPQTLDQAIDGDSTWGVAKKLKNRHEEVICLDKAQLVVIVPEKKLFFPTSVKFPCFIKLACRLQ